MHTTSDPLVRRPAPERLHYAAGELLGADDFQAEQTYHRSRLALALAHLHGCGTIRGLKAIAKPMPEEIAGQRVDGVHLEVSPGLAFDRAGRLIEVPGEVCLRLRRWYEFIAKQPATDDREFGGWNVRDLIQSWRAADPPRPAGVIADLFVKFHACEHGLTPSLASGPFDALNATQPARVRDAFEFELVPRAFTPVAMQPPPPLPRPFDPLAALPVPLGELKKSLLEGRSLASAPGFDSTAPDSEYVAYQDKTAVLLARIVIPAKESVAADKAPEPDWTPATWQGNDALVNNFVRQFVLPAAVLSR